jgi:hypothetical protein
MKQDNFKPLPQYMEKVTNLKQTTNQQWRWLSEGRCSHRHRYTSHFNCFLKEYNIQEKIGFLDTEFYVGKNSWGKLAGEWGYFLCWDIGDGKGHDVSDCIRPEELVHFKKGKIIVTDNPDKRIVESCIKEMLKYDRIIHHYGNKCDIPLLRTRALINKVKFPAYGELVMTDLYEIAKNKLTLSSNSQKNISLALFGETEKTAVESRIWINAMRGDQKSLNIILDHCKADVRDLERNAKGLLPYVKKVNRSI